MPQSQKQLDNLKKGKDYRFTPENASEMGRRGQKASVEAQKRKRSIASSALEIHDTEVTDNKDRERLAQLGVKDNPNNASKLAMAVFEKAVAGDISAVDKFEQLVEKASVEYTGALEAETRAALALVHTNYLPNISTNFGQISAAALKHRYTHYEVFGGRGSLKSSWTSLTVIRLLMEHPDLHALVLRKVANTMRDSVYAQYIWAIGQLGVSDYWEARKSPLELIYRPTGQRVLFRGADDPMKIKSIKVPFGYIGITHFEEKDQFSGREEIDMILQSTMRGGSDFWNFETYNPPLSRDNWANKDSADARADRIQHHSSYLDLDEPDWLGERFIAEAEDLKLRNERRYRHEYLGEAVGTGGNVFENLELRTISDEEMKTFSVFYQGVDWGWFPDPYAFIRLSYDPARETVFLLDEHVGNNMTNEESAAWIRSKGYESAPIICDSAEPKSVSDYRALGLGAKPCTKGKGSVDYGMKWLQGRIIVIDKKRTPHAYEEFVHYEYDRARDGSFVSGYPDAKNHTIDATRYALERVIRNYRSNA
ncbi:MAG: PBSX family phage terminase large subunit [Oscillospiraceae bacterium]|nr:PBSX family phage terminase large subunit [Oscillospiraceae bacterium]